MRRGVVLVLAAAMLILVFSAYLNPDFIVDLGNRWAMCYG